MSKNSVLPAALGGLRKMVSKLAGNAIVAILAIISGENTGDAPRIMRITMNTG